MHPELNTLPLSRILGMMRHLRIAKHLTMATHPLLFTAAHHAVEAQTAPDPRTLWGEVDLTPAPARGAARVMRIDTCRKWILGFRV